MRSKTLWIMPALMVALAVPASAQTLEWVYAAKFVCGLQGPAYLGEPVVKPGNYATDINVHNPQYSTVTVRKKFILLVNNGAPVGREPAQQGPAAFDNIVLNPDFATMDDCIRIWTLTHPGMAIPTPLPLNVGYVVFLSKEELDVDVVYTSIVPGPPAAAITGDSIDVERVVGKQVVVPPPAATETEQ